MASRRRAGNGVAPHSAVSAGAGGGTSRRAGGRAATARPAPSRPDDAADASAPPVAVQLCDKLRRWRCAPARRLRASALAYLRSPGNVQLEAVADWLAAEDSVTDDNVVPLRLSAEEVAIHQDLAAANKLLSAAELKGQDLGQWRSTSALQRRERAARQAAAATQLQVDELTRRLEELRLQREQLLAVAAATDADADAVAPPTAADTRPPADGTPLSPAVFAALDAAVDDVHDAVTNVLAASDEHADIASPWYAHCDMEPYMAADKRYTQATTTYMEKQFHTGLSKVVEELLSAPDDDGADTAALLKGPDAEAYRTMVAELHSLQASFATAETEAVHAAVELSGEKALVRCAVSAAAPPTGDASATATAAASATESLQESVAATEAALADILSTQLPAVVSELASLDAAPVLLGDHQLKLLRQQYHTSKQAVVIEALTHQFGRHRLLKRLLQAEQELLAHTSTLLADVRRTVYARVAGVRERLAGVADMAKVEPGLEPTHVLIQTAADIMGLESERATGPDVAAAVTSALQHSAALETECEATYQRLTAVVDDTRSRAQRVVSMHDSPMPEYGGHELESFSQEVLGHMQDTLGVFKNRGRVLHRNPLLATERAIPVAYFGGHHHELQSAVDELTAKVQRHVSSRR